ncbi:unnamed protein product [Microthlaspi erraticum]|uniref:Pentatricopeptide repeat-containing protein n=1 Tax=Microthlaspi erraticum TaxID=1685480 RepID=A0A6D2ILZ0_9BRAS|nr:unnamed protein product [Microthlaspi erraticum]
MKQSVNSGMFLQILSDRSFSTVKVKEGYYALGLEYVMAYAGKDVRLDVQSFGSLAGKLVKRKRFEEAKIVLKEMVKFVASVNLSLLVGLLVSV